MYMMQEYDGDRRVLDTQEANRYISSRRAAINATWQDANAAIVKAKDPRVIDVLNGGNCLLLNGSEETIENAILRDIENGTSILYIGPSSTTLYDNLKNIAGSKGLSSCFDISRYSNQNIDVMPYLATYLTSLDNKDAIEVKRHRIKILKEVISRKIQIFAIRYWDNFAPEELRDSGHAAGDYRSSTGHLPDIIWDEMKITGHENFLEDSIGTLSIREIEKRLVDIFAENIKKAADEYMDWNMIHPYGSDKAIYTGPSFWHKFADYLLEKTKGKNFLSFSSPGDKYIDDVGAICVDYMSLLDEPGLCFIEDLPTPEPSVVWAWPHPNLILETMYDEAKDRFHKAKGMTPLHIYMEVSFFKDHHPHALDIIKNCHKYGITLTLYTNSYSDYTKFDFETNIFREIHNANKFPELSRFVDNTVIENANYADAKYFSELSGYVTSVCTVPKTRTALWNTTTEIEERTVREPIISPIELESLHERNEIAIIGGIPNE